MERLWLALGALIVAASIGWDAYRSHGLEKMLRAGAETAEPEESTVPAENAVATEASPSDTPVAAPPVDPARPAAEIAKALDDAAIAARYGLLQGLGLLLLGAILSARTGVLLHLVALGVLIGTALFSGGLVSEILAPKTLPPNTIPAGGMILIGSWTIGAVVLLASSPRTGEPRRNRNTI